MLNFEEVFEKFKDRVFRTSLRLLGDVEEARDVAQDVFLSAYKSYDKFREESAVYSWLYRITVNKAINALKKRKKALSLDEPIGNDKEGNPIYYEPACPKPNPEKRAEIEEGRNRVRLAIARLPKKYQEVVVLKEMEGISYEEIAKILGITRDVVGIRLFRAREMLRKELKNEVL
ncbi:MAG: RNA polymerase sigma factor [Candidatus Desantisbacteria bacterium]